MGCTKRGALTYSDLTKVRPNDTILTSFVNPLFILIGEYHCLKTWYEKLEPLLPPIKVLKVLKIMPVQKKADRQEIRDVKQTSPNGWAIHSAGHGSLLQPSVSAGRSPAQVLLSTSNSIPPDDLCTQRTFRLLNPPLHVLLQSPQYDV